MPDEHAIIQQWINENVPETKLKLILLEASPESVEQLDTTAETIGKKLASQRFTASQIRAVFGKVRVIEQMMNSSKQESEADNPKLSFSVYQQFRLLRPKLAYQYGRTDPKDFQKKIGMGILKEVLSSAVEIAKDDQSAFQRFVSFFEAILAYHRYYGGKI